MVNKSYRNRGITLIELLIVLGLITIVIAAGISIFLFSSKTFSDSNAQYNLQSRARLVSETIVNDIRYATDVTLINTSDTPITESALGDEGSELGYKFIYIEGDAVKFTQVDFLGEVTTEILIRIPEDDDLSIIFEKMSDDTLEMTFESSRNVSRSFNIFNQIQILNIQRINDGIVGSDTMIVDASNANAIKYVTPVRSINAEAPFSIIEYTKLTNSYRVVCSRPGSIIELFTNPPFDTTNPSPNTTTFTVDNAYNSGNETSVVVPRPTPTGTPKTYFFTISNPDTPEVLNFKLYYLGSNNWALEEVISFD